VAALVREAIDARFPSATREDCLAVLEASRALRGRYLSPDDLDRLVEREREAVLPGATGKRAR